MSQKKSVSVRLSKDAWRKCEEAMMNGYSRTEFIDQAIRGIPYYDKATERELLPHFCSIAESIGLIKGNVELKEELREELETVCQYLNFRPEHI